MIEIKNSDVLPDVKLIKTKKFEDDRGYFKETYQQEKYDFLGVNFVQDNFSYSKPDVLRGMHFQTQNPQDKLVQCLKGSIYDVVVDIRKDSFTFGKWVGVFLSDENDMQLFVPKGFAHGFHAITEAMVLYKCTDFYYSKYEKTLMWNDPDVGIEWDVKCPIISKKDQKGLSINAVSKL